jgi:SAM-dependent methyltransferase
MKRWYEELFTNYAVTYDTECFTAGTVGEVDFLEKEFDYDQTKSILDIGCGTGRHAIELARRGYSVTGIDLSACQLERAEQKAKETGVHLNLLQLNACILPFKNQFNCEIMLCEGGFSLQETDALNFKILEGAERALRSPGKFVFSALNALFPLYHNLNNFFNAEPGITETRECTFDPMTFRNRSKLVITDDDGVRKELEADERYYAPSEISWYLASLRFKRSSIYGCRLGKFSRDHTLTTDDLEMLVIAEK